MGLQRSLSQILRPAMIFWQGALELPKAPDVQHEFDRIMKKLQARSERPDLCCVRKTIEVT
jgi:hypothetical protein